MSIEKKIFGKTKNNEEVYLYKLSNEKLEIEILNYGGIIKSIIVPDKNEVKENVVLSYDSLEKYENSSTYFGCVTGRVAGRIKKGILNIGKNTYQLECNDGKNNLHGGFNSLNTKVWEVISEEDFHEFSRIILKYDSPHLENNFPGNVSFVVSYTLKGDSLTIEYVGVPDRETYINLTNHTYFNLNGENKKDISNQKITINANEYVKVDKETIPTEICSVKNKIFDLRKEKEFKEIFECEDEQIEIVGKGLDHAFVLNKLDIRDCVCKDLESGRVIEIQTDQPAVVLYTGNYLEPNKHFGFCLETQDYPDIQNLIENKMTIYTSLNPYKQRTKYKFSVEEKC